MREDYIDQHLGGGLSFSWKHVVLRKIDTLVNQDDYATSIMNPNQRKMALLKLRGLYASFPSL